MKQFLDLSPGLGLATTAVGATTRATPSPLQVSANGRVLVGADERPVFLLADTAWSLVLRPKREEAEAYLRQRHPGVQRPDLRFVHAG